MSAGRPPAPAGEIAGVVPMARLLEALGFAVNERTRRCACILHGGSNPSAFSWREDGVWRCHSCGAGGDKIALVRAVRQCSFYDSLEFLAALAGVTFPVSRLSRRKIERDRIRRKRAEAAAWSVRDEILRLRMYYRDRLHRAERLWLRFGEELHRARNEEEREMAWERMARLAPAQTFFLAAYDCFCRASGAALVRFALAPPEQRRALVFGDDDDNTQLQAA